VQVTYIATPYLTCHTSIRITIHYSMRVFLARSCKAMTEGVRGSHKISSPARKTGRQPALAIPQLVLMQFVVLLACSVAIRQCVWKRTDRRQTNPSLAFCAGGTWASAVFFSVLYKNVLVALGN